MRRPILDEVLSQHPNKPLYHYTEQSGLLGIVSQKQIWATHSQYLNDRKEFTHALDLIKKELTEFRVEPSDEVIREAFESVNTVIPGSENMNVCVCSFSEDGDSLSQWRAYGGRAGFAIGFDGAGIAEAVEAHDWFLGPCIYDVDEQRKIILSLLEETIDELIFPDARPDVEDESLWRELGGNFRPYLTRYAPLLKHPSFKEEREWRIISRPIFAKRLNFREGASLLVPYYPFPLAPNGLAFRVHEIVIGPTPEPERSLLSVKSFLVRHHLGSIPIRVSEVPFRNW